MEVQLSLRATFYTTLGWIGVDENYKGQYCKNNKNVCIHTVYSIAYKYNLNTHTINQK